MWNKIKGLFDATLWKFLLVGVANTLVGTAVMFGLYNLAGLYRWGEAGYWISSAANYVVGSVLSYFLNRYFTFQSRAKGSLWKFVVEISACYLIAYGAARPLVRMALAGLGSQVQDNAAMLVGMCLFVGLNYLGQRFFVFRDEKE